ncbi:MAG: nicotinic acid mononucleotide adenylyltransferase [Gallionellales bacterium RIFCSPLOWO2_12_FULL_59_22]|nr:MAG: nicotinic acid mononucleotide adenylyltransferase [Gallionellales bacterium RIFCSPLOWO2_02_FULL_59_110]OGT03991.1 MAG: nicotinic acid mononucleotide adenylyltransferase [Gallionellales bacterium RIFCSPLOWO2_02_58_13]OGT13964.1 MAG: nicotinic acid mononucleotide adenylyltransferase [Gallionellales bacterium RIFCSPLOWO2_12_FULL_59_22]
MSDTPIGILGGTFDPIHFGHLRLAEEMLELANLRQIRFIPTGTPPHRDAPQVSAQHRSAMVRLAISGQPAFVLDEREVNRNTSCYTVDTLHELRAELGAAQPLCLLMGGDAFLQLHTWHEWEQLFGLAHIVVGYRPGFTLEERIHTATPVLCRHYQQRLCSVEALSQQPCGGITELAIPKLEISATDIRRRVAEGRTIRYLLPDAVSGYIYQHHLYQPC